jgi:putative endonuclease
MNFHLYILFSESLQKFYVGHTGDDLQSRLKKHLTDHKGFTSTAKDWSLVYTEAYATKEEAYKREMTIKGWKSKKMIQQLINKHSAAGSVHPDL